MLERLSVGPLGVNAYFLSEGHSCVLVDPGDEAERILAFLDRRGFQPILVVATHGHLDHTSAIPQLFAAWQKRGLSVPLAAHSGDLGYFGPEGRETNRRLFASIGGLGFYETYWRPLPLPSLLLAEGDALPIGNFRVIHSPGHSPGSICLYDDAASVLVSGDTLFRDGVGRTDFPDSDGEALAASLRRLLKLPNATVVHPGHGAATSIGRESGLR
jgi:glyoxylase-like metal-dependent hydrolase (beta-lactamase superfamily II)